MAKTDAERMRAYRKRNKTKPKCNDSGVVTPECNASLPADVQAEIEKMCAENNDGERAASHSRAAMTERALAYHKMFGGKPKSTRVCPVCGGAGQSEGIFKCSKCSTDTPAPKLKPTESGPLSVYSPDRWAYLQSRGHVWDSTKQRSTRPGPNGTIILGVTVPGDPAYTSVEPAPVHEGSQGG